MVTPSVSPTSMAKPLKWGLLLAPVVIIAGVAAWFWDDVFHAFGIGVILVAILILTPVLILGLGKHSLFREHWNKWLGGIVICALIFGILAFFVPVSGPLEDYSLGGNVGTSITGNSRSIGGVVRLVLLAIVALAFFAPHFTWRSTRTGAKKGGALTRDGYIKSRDYYREHPLHQRVTDRVRKRPDSSPETEGASILTGAAVAEGAETQAAPTAIIKGASQHQAELEPVTQETMPDKDGRPQRPPGTVSEVGVMSLSSRLSGEWQLPSIDLLDRPTATEFSPEEMERRAQVIVDSLASYGVDAKVVEINPGPAVTQFGIEPGWDRKYKEVKVKDKEGNVIPQTKEVSKTRVKVERIKALENDIALALAAPSIRIEAPVPGKSLVGIEVPNSAMTAVSLRETMESPHFHKLAARSKLAVALGKGSAGEMVSADLAKMPHLLIAGATGSGKTVCLDSVIASLLIHNTPDDLQFVMVDPKRVELTAFEGVPHLAAPVVTDADRTVTALKWLTHEMEGRYRKLSLAGANNIEMYNKGKNVERPLPYLVLVIDELADLMMAKQAEVEPLVCRLAQMGRAVGIHEVIATQRPSVDVVTGLIKANFPTRISFALVSQVDSRTILDNAGAEKLLGRGDMLYLPSDAAKPTRLQGCFVSREEIRRVGTFWANQRQTQGVEFPSFFEEERDPLLDQARQLMSEHRHVSASFLQRQLRIGHARAEQILELLAQESGSSPGQATGRHEEAQQ
jgi:S-DNA-T family DNA segregation ATPase FtsK/SpoIIIE